MNNPISPLRRYQLEPFRAALRAAEEHTAGIVVCRMSRQAGKNEVSARFEGVLMGTYYHLHRQGVKAAPTQDPQAVRSLKRLAGWLRACGMSHSVGGLAAGDSIIRLGQAEWWFGSGEPGANVVGATADLALEFDEAQDFDQEKHDRDYSPMAAATAAARIYWGTAWTDFDVLETARRHALELEARDGQQRVFDVPWTRVAEEVPAYGLFVESERARLGHTPSTPHPDFLTQYELTPRPGQGRFLTPAQLALLQGAHPALDAPQSSSHNVYVAGLDVGGANMSSGLSPDETVLTIARAAFPGRGRADEPTVALVRQYAWAGMDHDAARAEIVRLLRLWRVTHATIDATGIGEPIANHLINTFGEQAITAFKFARATKSSLAYDFLAAVNTGALKVWAPDGPHHAALWAQLRLARAEALPGGMLGFAVDPKEGHDDRLMSVALTLRAAQRGRPRQARQRTYTG